MCTIDDFDSCCFSRYTFRNFGHLSLLCVTKRLNVSLMVLDMCY